MYTQSGEAVVAHVAMTLQEDNDGSSAVPCVACQRWDRPVADQQLLESDHRQRVVFIPALDPGREQVQHLMVDTRVRRPHHDRTYSNRPGTDPTSPTVSADSADSPRRPMVRSAPAPVAVLAVIRRGHA